MWVLIVMSWIYGFNGGGPVTTFQEFTTKERCQTVADRLAEWPKQHERGGNDITIAWCTEK